MKDVQTYLCQYIGETLLADVPVAPDEELLLSGLLDSLMVVRMIAHLEETFTLRIPATDVVLDNMKTAGAISDYLTRAFGESALRLPKQN